MKSMLIKIGGGSNLSNEASIYGEYIPTRRQKRREFYHTSNEKKIMKNLI